MTLIEIKPGPSAERRLLDALKHDAVIVIHPGIYRVRERIVFDNYRPLQPMLGG